jgi:hypothetical protein
MHISSNQTKPTNTPTRPPQRGRVYLNSPEPSGTFLAGPEGGKRIEAHGCPAFSLGEPYYSETLLPMGYKTVLDWLQEVAMDHCSYANPSFARFDAEEEDGDEGGGGEEVPGVLLTPVEELE